MFLFANLHAIPDLQTGTLYGMYYGLFLFLFMFSFFNLYTVIVPFQNLPILQSVSLTPNALVRCIL